MHAAVQVVAALDRASALPSLVVFDLDYTLWPYWQVPSPACEVVQILWADALHADLCILLPSRCEMKQATDTPHLYPEARQVLDALRDKGVRMAVASRTPTPPVASAFLQKLGGGSMTLVRCLQVSKLGVTSFLVSEAEGVSCRSFTQALQQYAGKSHR
eukprot:jgi/Astpho2/5641/Aster-02890